MASAMRNTLRFIPPPASAPTALEIRKLVDFVSGANGRLLAITGAGFSTESGVPDYRSPEGSYSKGHKPMTHQEFTRSAAKRARYWARSLKGWKSFAAAAPNAGHHAIASLQQEGLVSHIITQNVDGLHQQAGATRVLDLHGRNDEVECMSCGAVKSRLDYQGEVEKVNQQWMSEFLPTDWEDQDIRADGDAHLSHEDFREFRVPGCHVCGGILMPRIVFFGGFLKPDVKRFAVELVDHAESVIVLGSSCRVFSAFSLVKAAAAAQKPVAIVNIGSTRADDLANLRLSLRCGEILPALCEELRLGAFRGERDPGASGVDDTLFSPVPKSTAQEM